MNLQRLNKAELIDYVKELQLELKEMTERRDFWRKQYYRVRAIVKAHINETEKIE